MRAVCAWPKRSPLSDRLSTAPGARRPVALRIVAGMPYSAARAPALARHARARCGQTQDCRLMARTPSWKDKLGRDKLVVEPVDAPAAPLPTTARKLARLLVAMSVAAILFCGLFPLGFVFGGALDRIGRGVDRALLHQPTPGHRGEKAPLSGPLGFARGAVLRRKGP